MCYELPIAAKLLSVLPTQATVALYGSHVYGTATKDSDYDLQVIIPDNLKIEPSTLINTRQVDVHVHTFSEYQSALADHEIWAIEVYFTPLTKYLRVGRIPMFLLDIAKLRSSISEKASNSWVKAKKKLIVEADRNEWIAKKSLFHSLRIISFGIQLATYGKINDFASMNYVLEELRRMPADWNILDDRWRPMYKELSSIFREVCPKKGKKHEATGAI